MRRIFDPLGDEHYYGCAGVRCIDCLFYNTHCKYFRNKYGYEKELI